MSKELIFEDDARNALKRGIDKVANAVKVTLGPKGKTVVIGQKYGNPIVTKDGVTVAKHIDLPDHFENLGAQLCKEVSGKTNDVAGDGTTTATVLAQAIVNEGIKHISNGGNSVSVKKGIDKALDYVLKYISENNRPVSNSKDIEYVASIAGNDVEIGKQIATATEKIGKDGIITLEESSMRETTVEIEDGYNFDKGYEHVSFVNDQESMLMSYENPLLVFADKKLDNQIELADFINNVLTKLGNSDIPIVFVAPEFGDQIIRFLSINRQRSGLKVGAVRAPGFGIKRTENIEDMAFYTGGEVLGANRKYNFDTADIDVLGKCKSIKSQKDSTLLLRNDSDSSDLIKTRINSLKTQLSQAESDYDKEKLQERISKLSGSVAVIKVGASTETELKEKKHRYEDALSATRAAIEEGIVVGGGVTLLRASLGLASVEASNEDERRGIDIVRDSLFAPIKMIAINAGQSGPVVVNQTLTGSGDYGYNAATDTYENLMEVGVIDPAKVTKNAIQNACSIASLVLTCDCVINDIPSKTSEQDGIMM